MLTEKENTRLSKTLSYVLRHNPADIGITLDENGWVGVDELLAALKSNGDDITFATLKYIVETNNKKRFGFNEDKTRIRANQGHSVEVDLAYAEKEPPAILYHGTVQRFMDAILKDGLQKMSRHHVHLSGDIETAAKVAQRRGKPVILKIKSLDMHAHGHVFYLSDNGVWLTNSVSTEFIEL